MTTAKKTSAPKKTKDKPKVIAKKSTKKATPKKKPAKKVKIKPFVDDGSHKSIYILGKAILEIIEILGINLDVTSKRVVKILEEKERVSENELAEQLGVKINTVRKALYALDSIGFAYYIKEKDEEKKWWYIYYWTLNLKRVKEEYLKNKRKELLAKEDDLLSEQEYSFRCKSCKSKCNYEAALNSDFKCPDCACALYEIRTTRDINKLREEIFEIRKEIGLDRK